MRHSARYTGDGSIRVRDDAGGMFLITTNVARPIHREAAEAKNTDKTLVRSRRASASENPYARKAMIDSAAPHIPAVTWEFNCRLGLFNGYNGTLDLPSMTHGSTGKRTC